MVQGLLKGRVYFVQIQGWGEVKEIQCAEISQIQSYKPQNPALLAYKPPLHFWLKFFLGYKIHFSDMSIKCTVQITSNCNIYSRVLAEST